MMAAVSDGLPTPVQYELRAPREADLESLYGIYRLCYFDYVRLTWGQWEEESQHQGYLSGFPLHRAKMIVIAGRRVGAVDFERRGDGWWLNNIEIAPNWQNRGIGGHLVSELLLRAGADGVPAFLECLKVNPARRLYERLGFRVTDETTTHYVMRADPSPAEHGQERDG